MDGTGRGNAPLVPARKQVARTEEIYSKGCPVSFSSNRFDAGLAAHASGGLRSAGVVVRGTLRCRTGSRKSALRLFASAGLSNPIMICSAAMLALRFKVIPLVEPVAKLNTAASCGPSSAIIDRPLGLGFFSTR